MLLGTAVVASTFGLRCGRRRTKVAVIDDVTRKLLTRNGQRPTAVGLFFSLDHSTVVVAASVDPSRPRLSTAEATKSPKSKI